MRRSSKLRLRGGGPEMKGKLSVFLVLGLFGILSLGTCPGLAEEENKSTHEAATQDPGAEGEVRSLLDDIKETEDPEHLNTVDAAVKKLAGQLISGLEKTRPGTPLKIVVHDLLGPGKDKDLTELGRNASMKLVTQLVNCGKLAKVLERDEFDRLIIDQMFEQEGPFDEKTVHDPAEKIGMDATVYGQIIRAGKGLEIHARIVDHSGEVLSKGEVKLPDLSTADKLVETTFTVVTIPSWSGVLVTIGGQTKETEEGIAFFELLAGERTLIIRGTGVKAFTKNVYPSDEDSNYYHELEEDDQISPKELQELKKKQEKAAADEVARKQLQEQHERWKEKTALEENQNQAEFERTMELMAVEKELRELKLQKENSAKKTAERAAEKQRLEAKMQRFDAEERVAQEQVAAEERRLAQEQLDDESRQRIEEGLVEMRSRMAQQQIANKAFLVNERRRLERQRSQLARQMRSLEDKRQRELRRRAELKRQQKLAHRKAKLKKREMIARQKSELRKRQAQARKKAELRRRQAQARKQAELRRRQQQRRRR